MIKYLVTKFFYLLHYHNNEFQYYFGKLQF